MDLDLIFSIGVVIAVFAIPVLVGAISDKRFPRRAIIMMVIGGGMVYYAAREDPDAYTVATADDVFVAVIGRYVN